MKREIGFRAWDKQENKWYEPIYKGYAGEIYELSVSFSGELYLRTFKNGHSESAHESTFKDRYVLQRYTGLKDSEGKEVYEGDIMEIEGDFFETQRGEVVFVTGSFYIGGEIEDMLDAKIDDYGAKVVGNIFENQNLLTQ